MDNQKKNTLPAKVKSITRCYVILFVVYSTQVLANNGTHVMPILGPWKYTLSCGIPYTWTAARRCDVWFYGDFLGANSGGCINQQDPFPWTTESKLLPKAKAFRGDVSGTFHGWLKVGETINFKGLGDSHPSYRLGAEVINFSLITTKSLDGVIREYLARRDREYSCPPWSERHNNDYCLAHSEKNLGQQQCVGNPVNPATGNKFQYENDIIKSRPNGLGFGRFYNSQSTVLGSIGYGWIHQYERKLDIDSGIIRSIRTDGKILSFTPVNGQTNSYQTDPDITLVLTSILDQEGKVISYELKTLDGDVERYDTSGKLTAIINKQGHQTNLDYNLTSVDGGDDEPKTLDRIVGYDGDQLYFKYDGNWHLTEINSSSGYIVRFSYDSDGYLSKVIYPDQTPNDDSDNPYREYHYKQVDSYSLLTGITDENGNRYATWSYDGEGRAISSEHADGVDKVIIDYTYLEDATDPRVTVTNPLGKQTTYHFTTIHEVKKVTQVEGHPTASCEGANKSYSYDANGNISSKTDWNGVTTNYTYDMVRNLELTRTEAVGTPQERTITTEWHADFRLPTKITESEKVTEYTYDAQGRQLSSKVSSVK